MARKKKYKKLCKYCEKVCTEGGDICTYCRSKQKLVKQLIEIGNMIKSLANEENSKGKS